MVEMRQMSSCPSHGHVGLRSDAHAVSVKLRIGKRGQ